MKSLVRAWPLAAFLLLAGCAAHAPEVLPSLEPEPEPPPADAELHVAVEPERAEVVTAADSVTAVDSGVAHRVPAREVPPAHAAWIEETIAGLSLREKIGQLMVVWTGGQAVRAGSPELTRLARIVEREGVGGVIISVGPASAYIARLNELQRRARVPLLVMTDMESGPGMRLRGGAPAGTHVPPAMALAATGSDSLAEEVGRLTGREARAVGVHLTLAPVLDVNSNAANPIINVRSYGEDPQEVARYATAFLRGAHHAGLLAAAKHFPGHGDTSVDSHIALATVRGDRARLDALELPPFRAAVAAGVDAVLVGHLAVPALDGGNAGPASLSPRVVQGLLREELGFDGLVITDALNMGGVTRLHTDGEIAVRAVAAGADLLLQPRDIPAAIEAVLAAVRDGRLDEVRIDASVRRVLAAKARAGLHVSRVVEPAAAGRVVGSAAHAAVARAVAERSLVLVRDEDDAVPLRRDVRRILSITYADTRTAAAGRSFEAELRRTHTVTSVRIHARSTAREIDAILAQAGSVDLVIASAQVVPRENRGSVDVAPGFRRALERLAAGRVPLVIVSFGSPYLLGAAPGAPAFLAAWGGTAETQRAAARALRGELPITGRLPVSVPPGVLAGAGLTRDVAALPDGR